MKNRLTAGITNIPTKVGRRNWEKCFNLLVTTCDVFGINEALSLNAKRLYIALAKKAGFGGYGFHSPNPILWDARLYRFVAGQVYKLHGVGPKHKRWPGFNAARYANVAVLTQVKGGLPIAVINAHLVPRGKKVPAWWRNKVRKTSIAKLTMLLESQVGAGRIGIIMGDMNMASPPNIPGVTWVRVGVDMIGVMAPKGYDVDSIIRQVFPSPTDHKHGLRAPIVVS